MYKIIHILGQRVVYIHVGSANNSVYVCVCYVYNYIARISLKHSNDD